MSSWLLFHAVCLIVNVTNSMRNPRWRPQHQQTQDLVTLQNITAQLHARISELELKLEQYQQIENEGENSINWTHIFYAGIIIILVEIIGLFVGYLIYEMKYNHLKQRDYMERENKEVVDMTATPTSRIIEPKIRQSTSTITPIANIKKEHRFSAELFDGDNARVAISRQSFRSSLFGV
eukprot:526360_1